MALTGQEVYLLVDDAEQLDESALEALMALAAGAPEGRPHVFLFGESSLIAQLEALSLEEERFHVIELQPYTEEETREYLDQRLEGAGRGIELFTADQISDIHESSDGWPGTINQVARDAMIEAMIASRSAVKRPNMGFNMPKKHVLAISAVVVVAVAAAWLMPGRSKAPTTGAPANEQAQLPLGQGTPQPNGGGAPAVEFAGNSQPMPLPLVGNSQPVMRGPLAEAAGGITEGDDGVPVEGSSATPPTVTTTAPPAGVPAGSCADTGRQACRQRRLRSLPPSQRRLHLPRSLLQRQPRLPPQQPPSLPRSQPPWPRPRAAPGTPVKPPGNYVVQILGTSSEAAAQNFVKEQGGEYRYFKKVLNGKPLYVITYGNFANRDAAVSAIKALPAKVQAGKPWPRTVASVQQELATTR